MDANKLYILTRYQGLGASSRIRFFDYRKKLENSGIQPEYQSLLSDEYLKNLYQSGGKSIFQILSCYIKRFFWLLFHGNKKSVFWIEKELFPGLPTFIDLFFIRRMGKVILDYDDAIHLNYQNASWGRKDKIQKLMSVADCVFAGSPELKRIAESSQAQKVVRVPTAVAVPSSFKAEKREAGTIGWIGSPGSEKYLLDLKPTIEKMSSFQFLLTGTKQEHWLDLSNVEWLPWSVENQEQLLQRMQYGIMPLRDSEWEKSKCSYKILLYQAWGVVPLASPVGMNREVIESGANGFLVEGEWEEAFKELLKSPAGAYQEMSKKAQDSVEKKYTYDRVYESIEKSLLSYFGGS